MQLRRGSASLNKGTHVSPMCAGLKTSNFSFYIYLIYALKPDLCEDILKILNLRKLYCLEAGHLSSND
jgi:hypothetical protein